MIKSETGIKQVDGGVIRQVGNKCIYPSDTGCVFEDEDSMDIDGGEIIYQECKACGQKREFHRKG